MTVTLDQMKSMSKEDMAALILKMQSAPQGRLTLKVNEAKGTVSIYGLQRFPVSLYPSQWERVLGMVDQIKAVLPAAQKIVDAKSPKAA
jgi:hypothetical protein